MTITFRTLEQTPYNRLRYDFVKQVEESGAVSFLPYVDTPAKGIPTIGVGFNLRTHIRTVAEAMGIDPDDTVEAKYVARLRRGARDTH